jgi:mannitol/fructose-specific phosphotransferase system IIA component (Ntr-type)
MKLTDILTTSRVELDLDAANKDDVIERLVSLIVTTVSGMDCDTVLKAVRAREKLMSTGVGNSVAIPHGKTNAASSLVAAFGRCIDPIEFDALDGQPVSLVFLLVGPEDAAGPHIKALSRISRLLSYEEFRTRLMEAVTPEEVLEAISAEEERHFELKG